MTATQLFTQRSISHTGPLLPKLNFPSSESLESQYRLLSREKDPELLSAGLLQIGKQLEDSGHRETASQIYGWMISQHAELPLPAIHDAQKRIKSTHDKEPTSSRLESRINQFLGGSPNIQTFLALTAGAALAYPAIRALSLFRKSSALVIASGLASSGCIGTIGGAFKQPPEDIQIGRSPSAKQLLQEALRDIPPGEARDYHTHLLTLDTTKTGGYINPRMLHGWNPIDRLKTKIYMSAAQVTDISQADTQYLDRLVRLIRAIPGHGKHYLLGFDQHYNADGSVNPTKTEFYVPNQYAWDVTSRYPDVFIPAISVHPNRKDAIQELERWGKKGVKLIKWLPNAQGIDASLPRYDAFYAKARELGMTILTHVGEEQAVHAKEDQRLGNPLRFKRALDQGVRIVMAHGGSLGSCEDLEDPQRSQVPCYSLVLRLMRRPRYKNNLYADISAMTQANRVPKPLIAFLEATEVHDRLVNGSDYPLPAINALIRLGKLAKHGLLPKRDIAPLREIYRFNPLLFDFALKRRLRHPKTGQGFPTGVFIRRIEDSSAQNLNKK